MYSVGLYARFQSSPKESYLKVLKKILRYLKGTQGLVLWYPIGDSFDVIEFADFDFIGYLVDSKSTSRIARFLGPCLVSSATKK